MHQSEEAVPEIRIRCVNDRPVHSAGRYVLYWMVAFRRTGSNFALQRAVEHAQRLGKPLLILEALRSDYRWASDRLHRFILDGMASNARRLERHTLRYYPYVEEAHGAGRGLLEAMARDACVVVTDDSPAFFLPRMVAAAGARIEVALEAVDSNGLLPLLATDRVFPTAHAFRRMLQRELRRHLARPPLPDPLAGRPLPAPPLLDAALTRRWPPARAELLSGGAAALGTLPIDHAVAPTDLEGGSDAAAQRVATFVAHRLPRYDAARNNVAEDVTSGLSPYLHFGHVSSHEVLQAVAGAEGWTPERLGEQANGSRSGWWGMSAAAEAFLDQLVTWRELGFNFAARRDDGTEWSSLPPWARATLDTHATDPRPYTYPVERLAAADTHDTLWNAAQGQLLRDGRIHNYLRMLWGKKILEWSASPQEALRVMLELNDRYALDGRDPNSASGICWCLGRYDRPWGPERPIFGTVRYMSSTATARKMRVEEYVRTFTR